MVRQHNCNCADVPNLWIVTMDGRITNSSCGEEVRLTPG